MVVAGIGGIPLPRAVRVRFGLLLAALGAGLAATVTAAVAVGPVPIPPGQVWRIVLHQLAPEPAPAAWPAAHEQIVWQVRLPRVLLGGLVGAGLAVVGTTLQALVRNPLADPYVFGITSGASVGAVTVILLGVSAFGTYSLAAAAFLGALAAFALVVLLAGQGGAAAPARLVLAGVAVAYALSAVTSFLVFQASQGGEEGAARSVLFWLLGGLGAARWSYLGLPAAAILGGTAVLLLHARPLNALLAGDETAVSLGVDARRVRRRLFALAALLTGVIVAVSGGIGFVGLAMPHAVRLLVGPDHRRVLPTAALLGAAFLIWVDVAARTAVAPQELPIGVITSLCGAPLFAWLLRRRGAFPGS